jgi:hypothetical protein
MQVDVRAASTPRCGGHRVGTHPSYCAPCRQRPLRMACAAQLRRPPHSALAPSFLNGSQTRHRRPGTTGTGRGKRHKQALIALACQRSDVLFALLRDGTLSRVRHHGICPRPLSKTIEARPRPHTVPAVFLRAGSFQPGSEPRSGAVASSRMPAAKPVEGDQPSSFLIRFDEAVMCRTSPSLYWPVVTGAGPPLNELNATATSPMVCVSSAPTL